MSVQPNPEAIFAREIAETMPTCEAILAVIGDAVASTLPIEDDVTMTIFNAVALSWPSRADVLDAIERGAYRALAEHLRNSD